MKKRIKDKIVRIIGSIGEYYATRMKPSFGLLDFLDGRCGTVIDESLPSWHESGIAFNGVYWTLNCAEEKATTATGRVMRLGKFLRKAKLEEWLREWETRKGLSYEWKITTSPKEVLSMSYERAWTSCMRPGGAYEEGPLRDQEMGSALILFFRPGASQPCGRTILRPGLVDGVPVIVETDSIYGNGSIPRWWRKGDPETRMIPVSGLDNSSYYEGIHDDCRDGGCYDNTCDEEELITAFAPYNIGKWNKEGLELNHLLSTKPKKAKVRKGHSHYKRTKKTKEIPTEVFVSLREKARQERKKMVRDRKALYERLAKEHGGETFCFIKRLNPLFKENSIVFLVTDKPEELEAKINRIPEEIFEFCRIKKWEAKIEYGKKVAFGIADGVYVKIRSRRPVAGGLLYRSFRGNEACRIYRNW